VITLVKILYSLTDNNKPSCLCGGNSTVLGDLSLSFLLQFLKNSFTETLNKFADYVPGNGTFSINKFLTFLLAATVALHPVRSKVLPFQT